MTTHFRTCPLCEAHCGLEIGVERSAVVSIRGDRDDPQSRGFLCPKAYGLKGLHEDPDRLRRPQVREGAVWREVSWDEALERAAAGLSAVRAAHGAEAIATYIGNPTAHDMGALLYLGALTGAVGSRRVFSAASCDQLPKNLACQQMFGGDYVIPIPDLDRTQYLVVIGANPLVSNGSLLTAPDMPGRLKALRARGGKLVVIDPRRTQTAEIADEHHAIRPGGDAALLLAWAHVLFDEGRVDLGNATGHVAGLEELETLARDFTPERVARFTGLEPYTVRRLARELAAAPSAAVYGRIGTCTQAFGTLASWAIDVVNVLTGNLDRPGGAMFPRSPAPLPSPPAGEVEPYGRWRTAVRGLPEVGGQLPAAALAEEIDAAGESRIRALITHAGNPVLSTPDGERLDRALPTLDFLVAIDFYRNQTTRHAHVILPPTSPLERSNADLFFYPMAARNGVHFSKPTLEPEADARQPWQILLELSARLARVPAATLEELIFAGVSAAVGLDEATRKDLGAEPGPDRLFDALLRAGPYPLRLSDLGAHGEDLGALQPRLPEVLRTPSRKIELAPPRIASDVVRLRAALDERAPEALALIGRRHLRSNNSWMHNLRALAKGNPRCVLTMHPSDASARGIAAGSLVEVRSRTGRVRVPVEISDEVRPGVVCLPHGFGHDVAGVELSVARRLQPGANSNALADGERIDALSGTAVLNGIPVTVSSAADAASD